MLEAQAAEASIPKAAAAACLLAHHFQVPAAVPSRVWPSADTAQRLAAGGKGVRRHAGCHGRMRAEHAAFELALMTVRRQVLADIAASTPAQLEMLLTPTLPETRSAACSGGTGSCLLSWADNSRKPWEATTAIRQPAADSAGPFCIQQQQQERNYWSISSAEK